MKIVTFGELMLRLSAPNYTRLLQTDTLTATFGGGEANVAVSLAGYGANAVFVSKLPTHAIGEAGVRTLRGFGVDTSHMLRGGKRIGVYYLETGASVRPSVCIYDRAHSALAEASPDEFDWERIFTGADWFHFSGITPALGGALPEICLAACQAAKAHGVRISCDLNYRAKLWSRERANEVMSRLCRYVDVCIANEEDAHDVFGISAPETDVTAGKLSRDGYVAVAKTLSERFGFAAVAITLRTSHSASDNDWAGLYYTAGTSYFSPSYSLRIVDRVGGGDSFCGGLIYALLQKMPPDDAISFAIAASAIKHTVFGDFQRASVAEVMSLVSGNRSGRVQR